MQTPHFAQLLQMQEEENETRMAEEPGNKESVFTSQEVGNLNFFQNRREFHAFTCEPSAAGRKSRSECPDGEGVLIATEDGWVCPCGAYTQKWAHSFMKQ